MLELLHLLQALAALFAVARYLPQVSKRLNQSEFYWEMQNTIADIRLKAKGHWTPVIIERLDDGTNPEQQHLRIDMARTFPQERLDNALYSWSSQSFNNVTLAMLYAVIKQASQYVQPGEERSTTVTLDVLSSGIRAVYKLHLQVDGNWQMVGRPRIKVDLRQHFAAIKAKSDHEARLRKEASAQGKAGRGDIPSDAGL